MLSPRMGEGMSGLIKARLIALAAMTALLAACGGGGGTGTVLPSSGGNNVQSSPDRGELTSTGLFTAVGDAGVTMRVLPTRDVLSNARVTMATSNLQYYGGPVQTAPQLYLIEWGSAWSSTGDPDGVASRLKSFYGVIGGGAWLATVTQYTQSNGQHVGNAGNIYTAVWQDTGTKPPSRPTQSQIAAEAVRAAAHFGNYSANASYVIAMPHGIKPSGFGTQYCAWHSSTSSSGGTIAYTNLPYMPDAGASCGADSVNSGGTLDGVTIVSGHEQAETETDPQPNSGWLDSSGSEIGDKCAWVSLENNPNAGGYPTQPLWSNANNGCVQSY